MGAAECVLLVEGIDFDGRPPCVEADVLAREAETFACEAPPWRASMASCCHRCWLGRRGRGVAGDYMGSKCSGVAGQRGLRGSGSPVQRSPCWALLMQMKEFAGRGSSSRWRDKSPVVTRVGQ